MRANIANQVDEIKCDRCHNPVAQIGRTYYDAALPFSPRGVQWGYVCEACWAHYLRAGVARLGVGSGQRYDCETRRAI